ncbi:hypothetical protein Tco_0751247 [Tanacetum coccineum]|uniref:Uncharacterized protein n=1 Tax=Tanacetum coccineum TaxID=301880 RepID=A0ABQ4Z641_9ASTR
MVNHSKKWHNDTSTRTRSTDIVDGLAAIQAQVNNLRREIKKVNEKVYAAQAGCELCNVPHYTKDWNPSYQERRQTMKESHSKFMAESTKRRDENYNLIKEIQASMDAIIRNQGASTKALEIQISYEEKDVLGELINRRESATELKWLLREKPRMGYQIEASINVRDSSILEDYLPPKETYLKSFTIPFHILNICFEKALADLRASVNVMPYSTFTNLGLGELAPTMLIIELADRTIKHPKGIAENVLVRYDKFFFLVDFIVLDMPEDIKVPLILGRPFLSIALTKIDVFKKKTALRVGDDKIIFKKLRRNQVEDLGPTIEQGEVIDEPIEDIVKTRNDDNEIIVENMDAYRDQGLGDVIVGKPSCREICVKARKFDGMITIYNGNDCVTYQMT